MTLIFTATAFRISFSSNGEHTHTHKQMYIHTSITYTCIHTYIHTDIHKYIHTYINVSVNDSQLITSKCLCILQSNLHKIYDLYGIHYKCCCLVTTNSVECLTKHTVQTPSKPSASKNLAMNSVECLTKHTVQTPSKPSASKNLAL